MELLPQHYATIEATPYYDFMFAYYFIRNLPININAKIKDVYLRLYNIDGQQRLGVVYKDKCYTTIEAACHAAYSNDNPPVLAEYSVNDFKVLRSICYNRRGTATREEKLRDIFYEMRDYINEVLKVNNIPATLIRDCGTAIVFRETSDGEYDVCSFAHSMLDGSDITKRLLSLVKDSDGDYFIRIRKDEWNPNVCDGLLAVGIYLRQLGAKQVWIKAEDDYLINADDIPVIAQQALGIYRDCSYTCTKWYMNICEFCQGIKITQLCAAIDLSDIIGYAVRFIVNPGR